MFSKIKNNKQVLIFGELVSTNGLQCVFVGHIHLNNLIKIENLLKHFAIYRPDAGELKISFNRFGCSYTLSIHKNHLTNKNLRQRLFKKHLKFQKFDETFYCGITRLRNTNFDAFIQCQYTRTALRKKNMGQSLFKKY